MTPALRRRVMTAPVESAAALARYGGETDNPTSSMGLHDRDDSLTHKKSAANVDGMNILEFLGSHIENGRSTAYARVVDKNVGAAEGIDDPLDRSLAGALVANIASEAQAFAADFFRHRGACLSVQIEDHGACAMRNEEFRGDLADAPRRCAPGDNRRPPCEKLARVTYLRFAFTAQ